MNRNLALIIIATAGILWASSGIAVQDFFAHSNKSAIDLTNIRIICAFFFIVNCFVAKRRLAEEFKNFAV